MKNKYGKILLLAGLCAAGGVTAKLAYTGLPGVKSDMSADQSGTEAGEAGEAEAGETELSGTETGTGEVEPGETELAGTETGTEEAEPAEPKEEVSGGAEEIGTAAMETAGIGTVAQETTGPDAGRETAIIVDAVQRVSRQLSFGIVTTAEVNLEGSMINDDYLIQSEIHVVQDTGGEELQMTMVNSSRKNEKDPENSEAYYTDGWYYAVDDDGKQEKEEKSAEDVMEIVTSITQMVLDASSQVEILSVEQDGENTRYTYQIPNYLAEDYLNTMAKSPVAEDTAFKNAKAQVDTLQLVSTVGSDDVLVEQELELEGAVKKMLFKVPIRVAAAAVFQTETETALEPPSDLDI